MKSIDTATSKEIAKYLNHLWDIAWEKSNHHTDDYITTYSKCTEDEWQVWRNLYHFIFSDNISKKIYKRFPEFEYSDPDSSYYRDISAFINAFGEFAENYNENDENTELFPTFEKYSEQL